MLKKSKTFIWMIITALVLCGGVGCNAPEDSAGDQVEEAADEVEDTMDEVGDSAEEAVEEVADDIE